MKQVSDSDDNAINVKLKEDKKKFVLEILRLAQDTDNGFIWGMPPYFIMHKNKFGVIGDEQ
jgi:hypothetical protein